uniref:ABC transporter domain-containing protein n=1 Tax=Physcomitrium patens TaxID=3218 RepID=A0A2K1JR67_PHYPA|nr:hypothetical protein PHYPA_016402 [Physcomitrium patens]
MFITGNTTPSRRHEEAEHDEEALKWAALEKLPTYDRLQTTILQKNLGSRVVHEEVDVSKIGYDKRREIIDNLLRARNLIVDAKCFVGSRALPTLKNVTINVFESILDSLGLSTARKTKLNILRIVSGIIKPGRMTLLQGPPSSGKTTLLLTLSGKLDKSLQKKRVTTAEMIVGPTKALFMDEISTGLDSSTTYQIVKCLSQFWHVMDATIMMPLLQPAPETFELFDDVVLLSEGQVVYHGPREFILEFFQSCGFVCPDRKGVVDFLQEVTSQKDQEQYWSDKLLKYRYVSVNQFAERFKSFIVGIDLTEDLAPPFEKERSHKASLIFDRYGVSNMELFKANFAKEFLLMKRQSFYHIFKACQIGIMAFVAMTTFFRTTMDHETEVEGAAYLGSLFFGILNVMFNGYAELSMIIFRLPVFYKQQDLLFCPPWAFALPSMVLSIPSSVVEAGIYTLISYYGMGFAPEASRSFSFFLLLTLVHLMSRALFRLIANTGGTCVLIIFVLLGGFIIPKEKIKPWWIWGYWSSPITYVETAITETPNSTVTLGHKVMRNFGIHQDAYWLQLLCGVMGAFRPGVLTALVGVSGAGKTTLMDVLAERKTNGYIEGEIRISGFPKVQETFAGICGYCEQNDIHSPQVTVRESLTEAGTRMQFVEEVMELVELKSVEHALVGLHCVTGLSTEQTKRLAIAVELVSNPSIVFMDEPTSGLDARAAAIVMRTVRNTVDTGRTVVCTIHQPSIDIFESIDEYVELFVHVDILGFVADVADEARRTGDLHGALGRNSETLIKYFDEIPGVPKIKEGFNPATWVLESTSAAVELQLQLDFAEIYRQSSLCTHNKEMVKTLSNPAQRAKDLSFPTQYSQSFCTQIVACLWKTKLTYWHSPDYNCVRYFFTFMTAFIIGSMFWRVGRNINDQVNLFSVLGGLFAATLFLGVNNASNVQPLVAIERTVLIEIPYCLIQSIVFSSLSYSMMSLDWTSKKFFYYIFIMYFTLLYFTYYGMMPVALTPNHQIVAIVSSGFYSIFNLFSEYPGVVGVVLLGLPCGVDTLRANYHPVRRRG